MTCFVNLGLPKLVQDQYEDYEQQQQVQGIPQKILQEDIWDVLEHGDALI